MGKHWVREQVRHDEMQEAVGGGIHWVADNRRQAGIIVGVIGAVSIITALFLYGRQSRENAAWDRLSVAQAIFYGGNAEAALSQAGQVAEEQTGTTGASYAGLFAGDVHFLKGNYKESAAQYAKLLEQGPKPAVLPLAQASQALAFEAGGQYQQGVSAAEAFLGTYSDHFLAPQVHASLARCQEAMGQKELFKATLQKISLQYPDSTFAGWAQARLQAK